MKPAQWLKDRIDRRVTTTGVIACMHLWPDLVEVLGRAGIDYMVIDLEHGAFGDELVAEVCALGRRTDFPVLIRPVANDYHNLRAAIDRGPCGLLLAAVEDQQTLDVVQSAIYMPPRGKRRPGGVGNRWVKDFNYSTWKSEVEDDFIILPQIETVRGLENAESIAAHQITTAIAVGPYDLSAELGVCWDPQSPVFLEAIQRIRAAGDAVDKNMWMIGDGPTLAAEGFTFLGIAEPMDLLEKALAELNRKTKAGSSGL